MKRIIVSLLCIICVLFTGCNSLFLGDTEVVLLRQEEFFPSSAYAYENAQKTQMNMEEGVDAFYMNPYHSKDPDDLLYFECLDMIGESTFIYGYQTIIREPQTEDEEEEKKEIIFETDYVDGQGVLKAYQITRDSEGNIVERKDVLSEYQYDNSVTGSSTAAKDSQEESQSSGMFAAETKEKVTPTPTPSPTPSPTPTPAVTITAEDGKTVSKDEEVKNEKKNIGKMVTQFMAYNFKTRQAHIIFKHITGGSEAQSLYMQELPQASSGWDRDYFLYFNQQCYYYRLKLSGGMKSELYNAADASFGIEGAFALVDTQGSQEKSIIIKNVCSTGQNDRIHISTVIERSAIDENTDIPEDVEEESELPEDLYGTVGIRIQMEFPTTDSMWFERKDGDVYHFMNTELQLKKADGSTFSTLPRNGSVIGTVKFENEYVTEWLSGVIDYVEDWYVESPPEAPEYPSEFERDDVKTNTLSGITIPLSYPAELTDKVLEYLFEVESYLQEKADYETRKSSDTLKTTTKKRSTITDAQYSYEDVEGYEHTGIRIYIKKGGSCFLVRYLYTMSTTMPYYNTGRIIYADTKAYVLDQEAETSVFYSTMNGIGVIPLDNTTVHTYLIADSELRSVSQMPAGAVKGIMGFSNQYIYLLKEGTLSGQTYYNAEGSGTFSSGNTAIRIPYSEIWKPIERTQEVERESVSTVTPNETGDVSNDTTITQRTDSKGKTIDTSGVNTGKSDDELLDGLPSVNTDNTQTNSSGVGGTSYFGDGNDLTGSTENVNLDEADPAEFYSVKNFIIRSNDVIITSRYCGIIVYQTGTYRKVERVHEGCFYRSFASSKSGYYVAVGYPETNVNYQDYDIVNAKAFEYRLTTATAQADTNPGTRPIRIQLAALAVPEYQFCKKTCLF